MNIPVPSPVRLRLWFWGDEESGKLNSDCRCTQSLFKLIKKHLSPTDYLTMVSIYRRLITHCSNQANRNLSFVLHDEQGKGVRLLITPELHSDVPYEVRLWQPSDSIRWDMGIFSTTTTW